MTQRFSKTVRDKVVQLVGPPYLSAVGRLESGVIRVLLVHDVTSDTLDWFTGVVEWIERNGGFLTPNEAQSFFRARVWPGPRYLLTFDDGFQSSFKAAREILEPRGIKVVFFVCPNFIGLRSHEAERFVRDFIFEGKQLPLSQDLCAMTWEEVESLLKAGHTIGSHTLTHARLSNVKDHERLHGEIVTSRDILNARLGVPVTWFAYPFGSIDSMSRKAHQLISDNYEFCCTNIRGHHLAGDEPSLIWRESLSGFEDLSYTKLVMRGVLDWRYYRRRKELLESY